MLGWLVAGLVLAFSHWLYYRSLDGKEVRNIDARWTLEAVKHNQEWKIRFGTVFAFGVKAAFAAAIIEAYRQHIWTTAKKKLISVAGLDAMFASTSDVLAFTELDFVCNAKLATMMALCVWCVIFCSLAPSCA